MTPVKTTTTASKVTKTIKVTIAGIDIGTIPVLNPTHATEAKLMSEKVYPALYIFENSVRDLIERVLKAQFGPTWWTTAIPGAVQATAAKHKADEKKDPRRAHAIPPEPVRRATSIGTSCSTTRGGWPKTRRGRT